MDREQAINIALKEGAYKAAVIPVEQVVLSAHFRDICATNSCGRYGTCWMCPPDVGPVEELMAQIGQFTHGLIYQTVTELEDSFDIEGMSEAGIRHARVSRSIGKKLLPLLGDKHLHLICGHCGYCKRCAKVDGKPCYFPEEALPSLEAYGVDVYQTVKDTPLKYINGPDTVTYFSMILFSEGENA